MMCTHQIKPPFCSLVLQIMSLTDEMRDTAQKFILRLSDEIEKPQERLVFLINNYDVVLAVLQSRTTTKVVPGCFLLLLWWCMW